MTTPTKYAVSGANDFNTSSLEQMLEHAERIVEHFPKDHLTDGNFTQEEFHKYADEKNAFVHLATGLKQVLALQSQKCGG